MELSKDEEICVVQHLIAQHRQCAFRRKADRTEPCEKCSISHKCFNNNSDITNTIWYKVFSKLCKSVGIKSNFILVKRFLEPYKTKDN